MDFKVNIGLEFHIQLKTKYKLFSNAINAYGDEPNTNISLYDIGFPGVLPLINKEPVILAIRAAKALNMEITNNLIFDRKHYFYSDLPKGYQITQEFLPLGRNGFITLKDKTKIKIDRLHIEEDACKQIHNEQSNIDFNRSGVPLIEIVTAPYISSAEQAKEVAMLIRDLMVEQDVSVGKMEEGSLRVDVNVSIFDEINNKLGTKVEIKNLNSFANICDSLNYEISKMISLIKNGQKLTQQTYRFDEKSGTNILMRNKEDSLDYRCIRDPNIPTYDIAKLVANVQLQNKGGFINNLPIKERKMLINNRVLRGIFEKCVELVADFNKASFFICNELIKYQSEEKLNNFTAQNICDLLTLLEDNKITNQQIRKVLDKVIKENSSFEESVSLILSSNFTINELNDIIENVISENIEAVNDYKSGKSRAFGFLVSKIKEKNDAINLKEIVEILKRKLGE